MNERKKETLKVWQKTYDFLSMVWGVATLSLWNVVGTKLAAHPSLRWNSGSSNGGLPSLGGYEIATKIKGPRQFRDLE